MDVCITVTREENWTKLGKDYRLHPLDHRTPPAVQVLKDDLLPNFL